MSSATSTERRRDGAPDPGLQPRHLFILLSMVGATAAVVVTGQAHPVALVILSATVVAAGLVGLALQGALSGFLGAEPRHVEPRDARATDALEREKALVLRSIKELEFDRAMGKISEADFSAVGAPLRARAVSLMQELEKSTAAPASAPARPERTPECAQCGTSNDLDARFCKSCGGKL